MPDMMLRQWSSNSGHRDDSDRDPTPLDPRIIPFVNLGDDFNGLLIRKEALVGAGVRFTRERPCIPCIAKTVKEKQMRTYPDRRIWRQ
jgi:hypothetical protein